VLKSAMALVMRSAWERLLSLIATLVLARLLVPRDFGVAAVILSATAVATIIVDGGITNDLVRRKDCPTVQRFRASRCAQFSLATIALVLAAAIIPLSPSFGLLLLIDAAQLLTDPLVLQPKVMLQRAMDFSGLALADGLGILARAVVSLAVAFVHRGPAALVVGDLGAALVYAAVVTRWLGPKAARPADGPPERAIRALREGAPFQAFSLIISGRDLSSNALIGGLVGLRTLGLFQFAYRALSPVLIVFASLSQIAIPIGVHVDPDNPLVLRRTRQGYLLSGLVTAIVVATVATPTHWLVPAVFGPKWASSVPLIFAMALALVINGPATTFGIGLILAANYTKVASFAALACTTFFLAALTILHQLSGLHALAAAWVLSAVVETLVVVIACNRLLRVRLASLNLIPIPVFLIAYGIAYQVASRFSGWLVPSVVAATVAATVSLVLSLPLTWRSAQELIKVARGGSSPLPAPGPA
jgi:PST family polysaccharide transporter